MRKELFRWWSITIAVLGIPVGILMTGMGIYAFLIGNDFKNRGQMGIEFIVEWRHERFPICDSEFGGMVHFMDRDGKHWGPRRVYEEVKAYWERNRDASSVSAELHRIAPGT